MWAFGCARVQRGSQRGVKEVLPLLGEFRYPLPPPPLPPLCSFRVPLREVAGAGQWSCGLRDRRETLGANLARGN